MYPAVPVAPFANGTLVVTGLPVASFLVAATVLLFAGLMLLRASTVLRPEAP